jgi:hypothetical protein
MIKGVILASSVLSNFDSILASWEQLGFFRVLLPFLFLFALVFGILSKINLFKENKVINGFLAFAVAFMALRFPFVTDFFSQIFPRLGVGLSIILVVFIVLGLFIDPDSAWMNYILMGIAALVLIVVLVQTAGSVGWSTGQWWAENWTTIAALVVILIFIVIIIGASGPASGRKPPEYHPIWIKERR